jgi:hypothetical protein
MALAARPTGVPIVMQLHDLEFECHGGDFSEIRTIPCVSNSYFTADQYRNTFGIDSSVIYPIILASDYHNIRSGITFRPRRDWGLDMAVKCARCRSALRFVEAWPLKPFSRREMAASWWDGATSHRHHSAL